MHDFFSFFHSKFVKEPQKKIAMLKRVKSLLNKYDIFSEVSQPIAKKIEFGFI